MAPALLAGLSGGAIIGTSAASLLLLTGDILGISGIVSTVALNPIHALKDTSQHWKVVFIGSFVTANALFLSKGYTVDETWHLSDLTYALAGALVGFGTKLGNGCTSGHGICGMARLSMRSITAVCTFMGTAITTTMIAYSTNMAKYFLDGTATNALSPAISTNMTIASLAAVAAATFMASRNKPDANGLAKRAPAAVAGSMFAYGLYKSQMIYQSRVLGFLQLQDPTLMMVMGGGLMVSMLGYQFLDAFRLTKATPTLDQPVCLAPSSKFCVPTNKTIDFDLVAGAAMFGVGWGLGGLCPGPALAAAAFGVPAVTQYWWPSFLVGSYLAQQYKTRTAA